MSDLQPGLRPAGRTLDIAAARAGLVRDPERWSRRRRSTRSTRPCRRFRGDAVLQWRLLRRAHQEVRPAARALAACANDSSSTRWFSAFRAACSAPGATRSSSTSRRRSRFIPGAPPQLPHRDQDMWRGAIGEMEYLVNVMWPFTRYTRENGATVVWPDSHGRRALDPRPAGRRVSGRARARIGAAVPRLDAPRRRRQCQRRGAPRSDRQLLPRLAQALREPVARLSAGDRAQLQPGARRAGRLPAAPAQPRQL